MKLLKRFNWLLIATSDVKPNQLTYLIFLVGLTPQFKSKSLLLTSSRPSSLRRLPKFKNSLLKSLPSNPHKLPWTWMILRKNSTFLSFNLRLPTKNTISSIPITNHIRLKSQILRKKSQRSTLNTVNFKRNYNNGKKLQDKLTGRFFNMSSK